MTWHTVLATEDEFQKLIGTIRKAGGVITRSCPCPVGFLLTYVTLGE
jgi:hypothetical protein